MSLEKEADGGGLRKYPFTAYFNASVLDPEFEFQWFEQDVLLDSDMKDQLRRPKF